MPAQSSFGQSTAVSASALIPGAILPLSSQLTGTIQGVYGNLYKNPNEKKEAPRIAFYIKCHLRTAATEYTSVDDNTKSTTRYDITFFLYPSEALLKQYTGDALSELIESMETERRALPIGRGVILDCSGMKVLEIKSEKKGKGVKLEGRGERVLEVVGKGIRRLLQEGPKSSATKSWFDTPCSYPSIPSPSQTPHPPVEHQPQPEAGPSRLRPLTEHVPPPLPKFRPADPSSHLRGPINEHSNANKGKRSVAANPPFPKRMRLDESAQADTGFEETKGQNVKTVISLGPSDRQASNVKPPSPPPDRGFLPNGSSDGNSLPTNHEEEVVLPEPSPSVPPRRSLANLNASSSVMVEASLDEQPHDDPTNHTRLSEEDRDIVRAEMDKNRLARRRVVEVEDQARSQAQAQALKEEARINRRREAEDRARQEGERRQAEAEAERRRVTVNIDTLRNGFTASGIKYTPLAQIRPGVANLVGIVIDRQPPKQTKTGDHTMTLVLADPFTHSEAISNEDFVVTVFRKTLAELPTDILPGTAMLFRGLKVNMFNEKAKGNAFNDVRDDRSGNTWASLPGGSNLVYADQRHMVPAICKEELDRLVGLHKWWNSLHGQGNDGGLETPGGDGGGSRWAGMESPGGREKDMTLDQVANGMFFNAVVKIMHIVENTPPRPALELYITDATLSPHPLRNYHAIDISPIPSSSLWTLAIKDPPPSSEMYIFKVGNVVRFSNVRAKTWKGEMELMWSELVTGEQVGKGWNRRRCGVLGGGDERVRGIEERIQALKRGELPPTPPSRQSRSTYTTPAAIHPPRPEHTGQIPNTISPMPDTKPISVPLSPVVQTATHLSTLHTDAISHPVSTITQILANRTLPNKFRVRARVKSIHTRGLGAGLGWGVVQSYCRHCRRQFGKDFCQSCQDVDGKYAELVYRFVVILEDEGGELAVIIADEEANAFLPPLPPLSISQNPNDTRKLLNRLKWINDQVHDILLGAKMDGKRERLMVDWSLEGYEVGVGRNRFGKGKGAGVDGDGVRVWRVFGMRGR